MEFKKKSHIGHNQRWRWQNQRADWSIFCRYTEVVVSGSGITAQTDNPEVKVNPIESPRHSSKLNEQMYNLRMLVSKLRNAYNGQDVDWGDDDEDEGETKVLKSIKFFVENG
jgi:hypothetical protein